MTWKFDPQALDLIFVQQPEEIQVSGNLDLGASFTSDITVDTGDRTNDTSVLDQGERIIDGNI